MNKARTIYLQSLCAIMATGALWAACSSTKHLPEGEVLYTGVKEIVTLPTDTIDAEVSASVATVLEVEPNSSLLGSAYHRSPFPLGLWIYNGLYTERERGLRHWFWNKFKSDPILISQVNPALRCQVAEIAMHDEGYFGGKVDYELVPNARNPKKSKIRYRVQYGPMSRISSIKYIQTHDPRLSRIVANTREESLVQEGMRFSASKLQQERSRIGTLMVDSGYFNYSSAYVRYVADTTRTPLQVALRIFTDYKAPVSSLYPCRVDSIVLALDHGAGISPNRFEHEGYKSIGYRGRLQVKPKYLYHSMAVRRGAVYDTKMGSRVVTRLARLNTFKYNNVEWKTLSSANDTTSLLMSLSSTYNMPWTGSIEMKGVYKDNDPVGPGLKFGAQRRNLFGGGELLSFELETGYEWNTGNHVIGDNHGVLNSYEFGGKMSLAVPRLQLPLHVDENHPVTTTYSVSADVTSRAGFFKMFKGTAEVSYSFSSDNVSTHTLTPVQLSYTSLLSTTQRFDSIVGHNPVLKQSFANQFIPCIRYTYTFDNSTIVRGRGRQWFQFSLTESGALLDAIMGRVGTHREQGERQLLWQPFSQFIKASVDFRHYQDLGHRNSLVVRLLGGIAYAYGNSTAVPYREQFFIGGANSLRGFSIRSVGPGTYRTSGEKYAYLNQTGDVKMEGNVEWRFPLSGDLYGALFADAGNVWTLRQEENRPGGQYTSTFLAEFATDCGLGFRYDLGMLVVRFDLGIPMHDPCEASDRYYNIRGSFFGNLGYHLAIGYPF